MAQVRQDNVQIKLEIDGSQSKTELDNLTRKADLLQQGLKEMKRGTSEYIAANKELWEVNTRMTELRNEIGLSGLSINQLGKLSNQLNREIKDLVPGTQAFINKSKELVEVGNQLDKVRADAKGVKEEMGSAGGGVGDFIKKAVGFAGISLGVDAVVDSVKEIGKEIFATTAKFETFEAVLTTALGDKSAAQYAMSQIADLAAKTPFSVDELTASYVKFVNRGIVPSTAEMQKLADVAASQGKSFDQLTEAVLDAGTGEFERLKEFGIQASKSGDQVELSFKGVTKTVANTPTAINAALVGFGELNGVMGSTASISATLDGQTSNLGDTVDQLEVQIGQGLRPAFVLLLTAAGQFLDFLKNSKGPLTSFINYFLDLYNQSLAVRVVVQGLGLGFQNAYALIKGVLGFLVTDLVAAGKVIKGTFTLDFGLIKQGLTEGAQGLVDAVKKTGTSMGQNFKGALTQAASTDKVALLGVSDADAKAAADSFDKAAARVGAGAKQKAAADAAKKLSLEQLKDREADIRAALALVASGSAEELRLKKLDVAAKRDIELADEKVTASERKVIRADAVAALRKLDEEYQKKQLDQAKKAAAEQADVEKKIADLKAGLLTDETEKRIQQLTAAAEKEKASAKGTAEQIAEQRQLIEQKLAVDVAAERQKLALKQGEEALDIEKRNNELIKDEWERRAAELRTAAASEALKILDTDTRAAEKRRLIQAKLQQDLVALERDRVAQQQEIAERIAAIDDNIALARINRRRQQSADFSLERAKADADEQAVRKAALDRQYAEDFFQEGLNTEQKLAVTRQYLQNKEDLENEFADRAQERTKAGIATGLEMQATALQTVADFQKIASDKELAKLDKDKKQRLAKLDAEYKAGTVSKDQYEAQKADIEANYDAKTRQIKKEAAEKEKELNIAQAVIQTALSIVKASPNVPLMVAAGVTGAASVAKIIATPIPEFAKGGVVGGPQPTWREKVRQFAAGGRINSRAGVADVGQRHSGGGIRMVDGATGEHLGEWEKGEPYMILSRDTYANNKYLVDELIDTSLYRGGAPVRPRPGYFEDGGVSGGALPAAPAGGNAAGQELVQAVNRVEEAVRALPSRQYIAWGQQDTASVEEALNDRADDRQRAQIK
ncbi:hypothetical protein GO988_05750 [Hymenobacter sp. HMF4947]|uniref:Phage tail tape measure protein domain-containing protein n=1 Tax=Hymenobacter ginkgonis TaxID=2682976 RepID=A0A7K1TBR2_9BACT|nr:hypothetical protein [Hymenobacter ginkgonis]MVN75825.1 hypothetical protein [Hymenobacter ginkgonis]